MHLPSTSLSNLIARDGAGATNSDANGCLNAAQYAMCNNEWNQGTGNGHQTIQLLSDNYNSVSWNVQWQWSGTSNQVKAYPNVISNNGRGTMMSDIGSMPSTFDWEYSNTSGDISADVSFDVWTGYDATANPGDGNGRNSYELMIWLASLGGAGPAGTKKQEHIPIGGYNWTLFGGEVQSWYTWSFVTEQGDINNYSGDVKLFYTWLNENEGVSEDLYLQAFQAGTEPFTGSGTFTMTEFSVAVDKA